MDSRPTAVRAHLAELAARQRAGLETVVPLFEVQNTPWREALRQLTGPLALNVVVDVDELADIDAAARPITIRVHSLPVGRILAMILERAARDEALGFDQVDGVIHVSTLERLDRRLETRIYPVADLLSAALERAGACDWVVAGGEPLRRAERDRLAALADEGARAQLADAAATPKLVRRLTMSALDDGFELFVEALVESLVASVEPDSWQINGGVSSVHPLDSWLVIRTSARVHREVAAYLAALRSAGLAGAWRLEPVEPPADVAAAAQELLVQPDSRNR